MKSSDTRNINYIKKGKLFNIINDKELENKVLSRTIPIEKKCNTLSDEEFRIPEFHEYNNIKKYNYKVKFLKEICKHYKQKVSGNKKELISRLFIFLRLSHYIIPIQKIWRKALLKMYNKIRGPARIKRSICVNETDFLTLEPLSCLPISQIYSYQDEIGQVYGFDIASIYNLLLKGDVNTTNPYNRQKFPDNIRVSLLRIIKLSHYFGDIINLSIEEQIDEIPLSKKLELRTIDLFHEIDNLGNYTNPAWFNNLNHPRLVKFIRELSDIWGYRAELSHNVKISICPPLGDPFRGLNLRTIHVVYTYEKLKQLTLNIIDKLITLGISESDRILGANYVLCALTLVSEEAANTMPWLYHSVAPII